MTNNALDDFLDIFYQLKRESNDKRYGFDDNWKTFIKKIMFLSPKSYGTKIQNRIIEKNGLEVVKANEDKGDFKKLEQYYEIKTSFITVTNKNANITGIRPWQDINGYYIFIIDARILDNIKTYSFSLTKKEIEIELKELKAIPLNGTKKANKGNKNLPLRFSLSLESKDFKRWTKNYLLNTNETIVKEL